MKNRSATVARLSQFDRPVKLAMDVLLDEFNVQVFSSGRVHWDRLDRALGPGALLQQLHAALTRANVSQKE